MVNLAYELKKNFECNPIVVNPEKYESLPELFNAVVDHARRWQRLENSTIEHRMRDARKMSKHHYQFYYYTNKSKWKNNKKYHNIISCKINKHCYDRFFQDLISIHLFHYYFIPVFGGF